MWHQKSKGLDIDKLKKHLWNATKCKLSMHTDDNSTDGKRKESEIGEILWKSSWYDCKKYASKNRKSLWFDPTRVKLF